MSGSSPAPDVSIVFANWNTRDYMRDCLLSIREHVRDLTYEIIVVDDGSTDGSPEMLAKEFPEVTSLVNERGHFGEFLRKHLRASVGRPVVDHNNLVGQIADVFTDRQETIAHIIARVPVCEYNGDIRRGGGTAHLSHAIGLTTQTCSCSAPP